MLRVVQRNDTSPLPSIRVCLGLKSSFQEKKNGCLVKYCESASKVPNAENHDGTKLENEASAQTDL
jgi:hypothetical protein